MKFSVTTKGITRIGQVAVLAMTGLPCWSGTSWAGVVMGRWPSYDDGSPAQRGAPVTWISHQKNDERAGWRWTRVENTGVWHWQHDVKIQSDVLSRAIHGNSDNHRLQVGEPAVFVTGPGCYRLEFFIKHDRQGDNPVVAFTVFLQNGRVATIQTRNIRGAGAFSNYSVDLMRRGINVGVDYALAWATGGLVTLHGQAWRLLDAAFPDDWLHQYRGWPQDAMWFAIQVGYLYARALPVR